MEKRKNDNEGHRERVRQKIEEGGIEHFHPHEVLEYLLFQIVPYRDTNKIAHEMLDYFGSFSGVLNAPKEELMKFPFISDRGALFLNSLPDIFRYYCRDNLSNRKCLQTVSQVWEYCKELLSFSTNEELYLICLDASNVILGTFRLAEGSVNTVEVSVVEIVRKILTFHASSVILAHSHPRGHASPSMQDEHITQILCSTLMGIQVDLLEHIIIAGTDKFYSFNHSGKLNGYRNTYLNYHHMPSFTQNNGGLYDDVTED